MSETDEQQIIRMLADPGRRRQGFEALVARYGEPLYWKIRRMVLSHDDADDVLQNTLLKAWSRLDTFENRSRLSTWLYRIAVNESLDFLRHRRVVQQVSADADETVAAQLLADEWFDGDETQVRLQEAVATLPDVQRTVFNLRYFDEMKYAEMSRLLGTSEGALKASYHLAVKKITAYLEGHG